jgi:hypothetical protein
MDYYYPYLIFIILCISFWCWYLDKKVGNIKKFQDETLEKLKSNDKELKELKLSHQLWIKSVEKFYIEYRRGKTSQEKQNKKCDQEFRKNRH